MHDETTLNSALNDAIEHWPNRVFLKIDGQDITFSQFEDQVGRLAAGLSDICGINAGDRVSVFMRNSLACEHTWFSANRLGAIWVPINTEFRGGLSLEHAVNLADAQVYVVDEDLYEILTTALFKAGIDATVVVASNEDAKGNGLWLSDLYLDRKAPPTVDVKFSDISALLYTSGTTGRSKACMLSHRYFTSQARIAIRDFGLTEADVLYCPFPLFHADATALTTVPALLVGGTAAISKRFSASRFWDEIREAGATVFDFMGATLSILAKAEPKQTTQTIRCDWRGGVYRFRNLSICSKNDSG